MHQGKENGINLVLAGSDATQIKIRRCHSGEMWLKAWVGMEGLGLQNRVPLAWQTHDHGDTPPALPIICLDLCSDKALPQVLSCLTVLLRRL